jgi:hypothetical protein
MSPQLLTHVQRNDLEAIRQYLTSHKLGLNRYRVKVGDGQSNCLGIVSKRSFAPDLSRQSWLHPRLHYLLMQFAEKYVSPHITFTSIQVNHNYPCKPHKDTGNLGDSYIVAFGDYTGGQLCIEDTDFDIAYRGLLFNGSESLHWTRDWTGERFSIVFHTIKPKFPMIKKLSDYEAVFQDGTWKIKYINEEGQIDYLFGKNGLPHPLKGRTKTIESDTSV